MLDSPLAGHAIVSERARALNDVLDLMERYRNTPAALWNEVLDMLEDEDAGHE